jgi:hypothetical protein
MGIDTEEPGPSPILAGSKTPDRDEGDKDKAKYGGDESRRKTKKKTRRTQAKNELFNPYGFLSYSLNSSRYVVQCGLMGTYSAHGVIGHVESLSRCIELSVAIITFFTSTVSTAKRSENIHALYSIEFMAGLVRLLRPECIGAVKTPTGLAMVRDCSAQQNALKIR